MKEDTKYRIKLFWITYIIAIIIAGIIQINSFTVKNIAKAHLYLHNTYNPTSELIGLPKHKVNKVSNGIDIDINSYTTYATYATYATPEEVFEKYGYGSHEQKSSITGYLYTSSCDGKYDAIAVCPDGNTYYYSSEQTEAILKAGNKFLLNERNERR